MIGDTSVGKSILVHYFINGSLPRHQLPITTLVRTQNRTVDVPGGGKDGKPLKIKLNIWDTNGVEEITPLTSFFLRGSHAIIVVYSVHNPSSYKSINYHLNNIN